VNISFLNDVMELETSSKQVEQNEKNLRNREEED